jgi:hypothetical protein
MESRFSNAGLGRRSDAVTGPDGWGMCLLRTGMGADACGVYC